MGLLWRVVLLALLQPVYVVVDVEDELEERELCQLVLTVVLPLALRGVVWHLRVEVPQLVYRDL